MDELAKEYVISFFNKYLQQHGDKPEAVRWTPAGQQLRYESLLETNTSIEGLKVLDYGCGKGDFCQFLKDRNLHVRYTGFDINEKLISLARQKFPECSFRVFDIESDMLDEDFDYIFLCGVFNLKVAGIDETVKNTLIKLFKHCRVGMVFNGLSDHEPRKDFELHYISPEMMLRFAVKNLSPHVVIRDKMIPHDFTMFVYRSSL
jgi:SAM-dependent methyltransferase